MNGSGCTPYTVAQVAIVEWRGCNHCIKQSYIFLRLLFARSVLAAEILAMQAVVRAARQLLEIFFV